MKKGLLRRPLFFDVTESLIQEQEREAGLVGLRLFAFLIVTIVIIVAIGYVIGQVCWIGRGKLLSLRIFLI